MASKFNVADALPVYVARFRRAGIVAHSAFVSDIERILDSADVDAFLGSQAARNAVVTLGDILFAHGEDVSV
jgi:hypothetical protein